MQRVDETVITTFMGETKSIKGMVSDTSLAIVTGNCTIPYLSAVLLDEIEDIRKELKTGIPSSDRGRLWGAMTKLANTIRQLRRDSRQESGGAGAPPEVHIAPIGQPTVIERDENGLRIKKTEKTEKQ